MPGPLVAGFGCRNAGGCNQDKCFLWFWSSVSYEQGGPDWPRCLESYAQKQLSECFGSEMLGYGGDRVTSKKKTAMAPAFILLSVENSGLRLQDLLRPTMFNLSHGRSV